MNPEQSSISIISKNNGQITGENAESIPIKLVTGLSWIRLIFIGFAICFALILIVLYNAQNQVSTVQVTGKGQDFQILQIN